MVIPCVSVREDFMKLNSFFLEKADLLGSSPDWSFKPRISSKYLLCAAFIFCLTLCLLFKKALLSLGSLDLLNFWNRWSRFRISLFIAWVIQGKCLFLPTSLDGINLLIPPLRASLKSFTPIKSLLDPLSVSLSSKFVWWTTSNALTLSSVAKYKDSWFWWNGCSYLINGEPGWMCLFLQGHFSHVEKNGRKCAHKWTGQGSSSLSNRCSWWHCIW